MAQQDDILRHLINKLSQTQKEELDCEEVFQLLDQYAESVTRGEEPSELFLLVAQHLEICKDCREEYDAPVKIIEAGLT
jgi:hypothetical protein